MFTDVYTRARHLATVLLLAFAIAAMAQTTVTSGVVDYTLKADGTYEATAFNATAAGINWSGPLVLESSIGGRPVTSIGEYAFYGNRQLQSLTLPTSVTTIGRNAFHGCNALTTLTLPQSVTAVGSFAFANCKQLQSLTILGGSSLTLSTSAFSGCSSLQTVTMAANPPQVGSTVFSGVGTLTHPVALRVPLVYLDDYLAQFNPSASAYTWSEGGGTFALHISHDGLFYSYLSSSSSPCYQIAGVDVTALSNQGTAAQPAYVLRSASNIGTVPVTGVADGAFHSPLSSLVAAIDLRNSTALSPVTVSRQQGAFDGVASQTMIYLNEGSTSTEDNVIVGGLLANGCWLPSPYHSYSRSVTRQGVVAYDLSTYWSAPLFGQRIGIDSVPMLMTDRDMTPVYRVTFAAGDTQLYRYANNGQTIMLPTSAELGLSADSPIVFAASRQSGQAFTEATPVTGDVTLHPYPLPTAISVDQQELTLRMSASIRTSQLSATLQPAASRPVFVWSSSDSRVATVSETGLVRAVGGGRCFITVRAADAPTVADSCVVTVIPRVTSVSISPVDLTLNMLSSPAVLTGHFTATCQPDNADQQVTWSVEDPNIATVDQTGLVTAHKAGRTFVYATPKDTPSMYAIGYVTVLGNGSGQTTDWPVIEEPDHGVVYRVTSQLPDQMTCVVTQLTDSLLASGSSVVIRDSTTLNGQRYRVDSVRATAIAVPTRNTLVFVPEGIGYDGSANNVVTLADRRCRHLIVTDGCAFSTRYRFTADSVTYQRALQPGLHNVALPYAYPQTDNCRFFALKSVKADTLLFSEVSGPTEAYVPYVVQVTGTLTSLGGRNLTIPTRSQNTDRMEGDYCLAAAMQPLSPADATERDAALLQSDGRWLTATTGIPALRSWLSMPAGHEPVMRLELGPNSALPKAAVGVVATIDGIDYRITALGTAGGTVIAERLDARLLHSGGSVVIPQEVDWNGRPFSVERVTDEAIAAPIHNTLVFIAKETSYEGTAPNVVTLSDSRCHHLIVTDSCAFSTRYPFTADSVTYRRELKAGLHAVCLPYALPMNSRPVAFFRLLAFDGDSLLFRQLMADSEPYVPYLAETTETVDDLGGRNLYIPTRNRNTDFYERGLCFSGAMQPVDAKETAYMLSSMSPVWLPVADGQTIPAFRSWLSVPAGPAPHIALVRNTRPAEEETGIHTVNLEPASSRAVYNLQGHKVGTTLELLPQGIYIIGGKKVVKR